jgi:hypothetical protein
VLYLNGEMRPEAVADRLRLFGPPPPSLRIWLAVEQCGPRLDLSSPDGLNRLVDSWDDEVDLVIIDSPSSLASGGLKLRDIERWQEMLYFLGGESGALRRAAALLQQGLSAEAVGKARSASRHERPIGCIQSLGPAALPQKRHPKADLAVARLPQDPSPWRGTWSNRASCWLSRLLSPSASLLSTRLRISWPTTSDRNNGPIRECCNRPLDLWSRRWSSP